MQQADERTCKRGHQWNRYESNNSCVECAKAQSRRQYQRIMDSQELREAHRKRAASVYRNERQKVAILRDYDLEGPLSRDVLSSRFWSSQRERYGITRARAIADRALLARVQKECLTAALRESVEHEKQKESSNVVRLVIR